MKRFAIIFLALLVPAFGQTPGWSPGDLARIGKSSGSTPITYDFRETFNASGYDNTGWTVDGTVNNDYTPALEGAHSCRIYSAGTTHLYRTFSGSEKHFYWRWKAITTSTYNDLWTLNTVNYYDSLFRIYYAGAGNVRITINGAQIDSDVAVTDGTEYFIWVDWIQDTTFDFYISTTATKPGSPNVSATAAEVPNSALTVVNWRSLTAGDQIVDDIIINSTTIGSNP